MQLEIIRNRSIHDKVSVFRENIDYMNGIFYYDINYIINNDIPLFFMTREEVESMKATLKQQYPEWAGKNPLDKKSQSDFCNFMNEFTGSLMVGLNEVGKFLGLPGTPSGWPLEQIREFRYEFEDSRYILKKCKKKLKEITIQFPSDMRRQDEYMAVKKFIKMFDNFGYLAMIAVTSGSYSVKKYVNERGYRKNQQFNSPKPIRLTLNRILSKTAKIDQ